MNHLQATMAFLNNQLQKQNLKEQTKPIKLSKAKQATIFCLLRLSEKCKALDQRCCKITQTQSQQYAINCNMWMLSMTLILLILFCTIKNAPNVYYFKII